MNKKEIADIRKEFKDSSYKMNLKDLYSVYIKKDGGNIIHSEICKFESFDLETKELYFNNFKKILSSSIDTKLFELESITSEEEIASSILYEVLKSDDKAIMEQELNKIIGKIIEEYKYDNDIIVNFIKGEYLKGNSKRNIEADEAEDDIVSSFNFIICSINKVEFPKKTMIFDYVNRRIIPNSSLEVIINLNSPLEGFMFPAFNNGYSDVNKIMYYTAKAKELNNYFVESVINCKSKLTAQDEKECFHSILATVLGEKVKPELIHDIYVGLSEKANEEEEIETISPEDIQSILNVKGIESAKSIEMAFEEVCGEKCDFKIDNIIPDFNSKSIKISSETAEITVTPKDLNLVRQVRDKKGNKCILIEITEDMEINGLKLETEEEI